MSSVRDRRRNVSGEAMWVVRARSLVHCKTGIVRSCIGPWIFAKLGVSDPARRPPMAMEKLSLEVVRTEQAEPFQLNIVEFLLCLCEKRRSAAFGP